MNGLAVHDHSNLPPPSPSEYAVHQADLPPTSGPLPISTLALTSTQNDLTTARLDIPPSLSDTMVSDDHVHQADDQRYKTAAKKLFLLNK